MRTASVVLGIISGVLTIVCAILILLGSAFLNFIIDYADDGNEVIEEIEDIEEIEEEGELSPSDLDKYKFDEQEEDDEVLSEENLDTFFSWFSVIYGIVILVAGLLGLIGAISVHSKNILAGVFMLIAGVIMLISLWGFIMAVMFILSGIFAFVKDNSSQLPQNHGQLNVNHA